MSAGVLRYRRASCTSPRFETAHGSGLGANPADGLGTAEEQHIIEDLGHSRAPVLGPETFNIGDPEEQGYTKAVRPSASKQRILLGYGSSVCSKH